MGCRTRIILLSVFLFSSILFAEEETNYYNYSLKTVYSTLIRFVVVDMSYKIVEKDIEGAYLIFEFSENNNKYEGKIELIERDKNKVEFKMKFNAENYRRILFIKKFNEKLESEQKAKK